jgi:hypothetical protein
MKYGSMKYRLVTLIGFVIAVTAIAVTSSRITFRYPPAVHETLAPRPASYLGVFEAGSPPAYRPIEGFSDMAGKSPNLAGYYSGWAEPFNMSFAKMMHGHGVIPYVQIDPSYASVSEIAAGSYDNYLRSYADSVRDFSHAVVIGFGHEMNGDWYSWGYKKTSHRHGIPCRGCRQRHLALDRQSAGAPGLQEDQLLVARG